MTPKKAAERICAEWNGYSQNHSGNHYLVAQAYLDLERKYAAAREVVEAARDICSMIERSPDQQIGKGYGYIFLKNALDKFDLAQASDATAGGGGG